MKSIRNYIGTLSALLGFGERGLQEHSGELSVLLAHEAESGLRRHLLVREHVALGYDYGVALVVEAVHANNLTLPCVAPLPHPVGGSALASRAAETQRIAREFTALASLYAPWTEMGGGDLAFRKRLPMLPSRHRHDSSAGVAPEMIV